MLFWVFLLSVIGYRFWGDDSNQLKHFAHSKAYFVQK